MYCPECEYRERIEYGFNLVLNQDYYTLVKEVKSCCPIKVTVTNHQNNTVTFTYNGKEYSKSYKDFMTSSWRDYEPY